MCKAIEQILQAVGEDVESVYSDELGISLSREELFTILVLDPLEGSIEVDWREFFPYLRWIPNQSFDGKLGRIHFRKHAVMTALIEEKKKRIASGQVLFFVFQWWIPFQPLSFH